MRRWFLTIVGIVTLPFLFIGFFLPTDYTFETSAVMTASPEEVRAAVAPMRSWLIWANWQEIDPSVQHEFSGSAAVVGETWVWRSSGRFNGTQVLRAVHDQSLEYDLRLNGSVDDGFNGERRLRWQQTDEGTRLFWQETVTVGGRPVGGYIRALVRNGMREYAERGLVRLQRNFDAAAAAAQPVVGLE